MSCPCPLCDGPAGPEAFPYETVWDDTRFRYLRCIECGTTYVDPLPSGAQLARIYSWESYHGREYATPDPGFYGPSVRELARHRPAPARLLDFGCGGGGFLLAAREAGYDCEGAEYDSDVARRIEKVTGVWVRSHEEMAAGAPFDVVVLRDVLPHLVEPMVTLRRLESVLKPGGALFLDGPLEEQASLVRLVAQGSKRLQRRLGGFRPASLAPTMLFRVDAAGQRRFLVGRMGYIERSFVVYETGWPYRVAGRSSSRPELVVKQAIGATAVAAAALGRGMRLALGNRFYGVYEPSA